MNLRLHYRPCLLALVLLVLDQVTKAWITSHFAYGEIRPVTSFFNLVLVHNSGAAFSFLADNPAFARVFFSVAAVLICALILYWAWKANNAWQRFLLWAVVGGALGNLIDRLRFGYVVDFLDFYVGSWHWPAFNVADSAVVGGVILYLLLELKHSANEAGGSKGQQGGQRG